MKTTYCLAIKLTITAGLCMALSGCASLNSKVKKAPCGPTAGMTDPCGNRIPINKQQTVEMTFDHMSGYSTFKAI